MRLTRLHRLCFAVLYTASVGSFASSIGSPFAWALSLAAAVSVFWQIERVPRSFALWLRRILWIEVTVAVLLGWIVMAYPILSPSAVRFLTLVTGYPLAIVGGLFLLGSRHWPPTLTVLPASVAAMVIAGFDNDASLHPYLLVAGGAGFAYLALGSFGRHGSWKRIVSLTVSAGVVFFFAFTIIRALPWAQGKVEESIVEIYTTRSSGFSGLAAGGALGEFERLKLSKRVVLRMWSREPRKLRGRVSTRFDGKRWFGIPEPRLIAPLTSPVDLDETTRQWLDDLPGRDFLVGSDRSLAERPPILKAKIVRADSGTGAVLAPAGTVVIRAAVSRISTDQAGIFSLPPLSSARIYGIVQVLARDRGEVPDAYLEECLEVPGDTDPRLHELAKRLAEGASSSEERLRRTVDYVASACRYSLDVGKFQSDQPVAEFLFEKKRGYCEYFASAAAILLRLQSVPTRYISGFSVVESNRNGGHFVVRESDSHAWIEAYLPDVGWVEADPTPGDEYESLHADLGGDWLAVTIERVKAAVAEFAIRVRIGDWRWLVGVVKSPSLLLPILFLGMGWMVRLLLKRGFRPRRKAVVEEESRALPRELVDCVRRLDREWKKRNVPRPANRAPLEHVLELPSDKVPAEIRETGLRVVQCYYRALFRGDAPPTEELTDLREAMKHLEH